MQHGQAVAEHSRGGDQDQDDGQGVHALVQSVPYALPIQALVNEHGHEQGVDNSDSSGLRGGEHAAHNAKDNDDNGSQCPDGSTQLLDEALDAEGRALGVVLLDGDDVGADAGIGQSDQLFRDAAGAHEHAHGDEERHGHQAEGRDALDHQTADIRKGLALHHQAEHTGKADGVCNGEPQEDHHKEADQKDKDRQCLNCHINSPPLQTGS